MTRRSSTILVTIVIPLVLISFLGVFVFMIPVESSSKIGFPIGILIVEVIFLNMMLEILPISARNIPILG